MLFNWNGLLAQNNGRVVDANCKFVHVSNQLMYTDRADFGGQIRGPDAGFISNASLNSLPANEDQRTYCRYPVDFVCEVVTKTNQV